MSSEYTLNHFSKQKQNLFIFAIRLKILKIVVQLNGEQKKKEVK